MAKVEANRLRLKAEGLWLEAVHLQEQLPALGSTEHDAAASKAREEARWRHAWRRTDCIGSVRASAARH